MHTIQACIITCIDYRFQKQIRTYLEKEGLLGEADIISIAGAAHDLVVATRNEHKDYLLGQVSASIALHHPKKVILIDHQDCGMYALSGKISPGLDFSEDLQKHRLYLEEARLRLQAVFDSIPVELVFAGLDGSFTRL